MAPPRKKQGGPQSPGVRLAELDTAAATAKQQGPSSAAMVTQQPAAGQRPEPPTVYASAFAPCAGRKLWGLTFICAWCGAGQFGRARTEAKLAGTRRTRCCGRLVLVKVARTYPGRANREAA